MLNKILMGYDGSESADKAFDWAANLAERYGARLHVVAIARPPDFAEDVESEAVMANSRKHCQSLLGRLQRRASERAHAHYSVLTGHPAEQLIIQAERDEAELIVLGHRGKSLFQPLRLGSVSKQVLHHAGFAVRVVR
jgi:nucleotide-binding universal stress UspA family protein